ncbi:MAG: tRNA lysidine(34) synthetase TilS, partial [Chitinophagaceae bacterium]|nr:tRNA lysidine(34) synthetase TilS [Chitinophagaceae bacterium]
QLRDKESEADEEFVRALADNYKVPVHVKLFETKKYATEKKVSVQVAARELRYTWFNELLHTGSRWLLTAHHAGDSIETMLMNFFRGTGIAGLRGIQPKMNNIVRPMLPFTKEEVLDFAKENQLAWREDSSNRTDKYSRNYFRNAILPMVKNIYPETENNLLKNVERFSEIEQLYNQSISLHKRKLLETRGNEIHIPILKLKKTEPLRTVVYEIIKPYHFSALQVDDVLQLTDGDHGKFIQSASHRIIRNRKWLIIAANEAANADFVIIEKDQEAAGNGLLNIHQLKNNNAGMSIDPLVAHIDARNIAFPMIFRKWKQGDYFYPLGMQKKKKVSRFLIDQKLSPTQKEKVMVLESDKRICWVAGMRIDDRFRVTLSTKNILELIYNDQVLK